jgi:uncharacterized short protein YbdD (DUF466 family)
MATHTMPGPTEVHRATNWLRVRKAVLRVWRGIRDWCGDSAYERYLNAKQQRRSSADKLLTQEQFYVEHLDRRYSRPNRCC